MPPGQNRLPAGRSLLKTRLYKILAGEAAPAGGSIDWGTTITVSYLPKDNTAWFESSMPLIQWLQQYTSVDDESYVRGFLGRMLFSGDESLKPMHAVEADAFGG